jgi:hypothetical protein
MFLKFLNMLFINPKDSLVDFPFSRSTKFDLKCQPLLWRILLLSRVIFDGWWLFSWDSKAASNVKPSFFLFFQLKEEKYIISKRSTGLVTKLRKVKWRFQIQRTFASFVSDLTSICKAPLCHLIKKALKRFSNFFLCRIE